MRAEVGDTPSHGAAPSTIVLPPDGTLSLHLRWCAAAAESNGGGGAPTSPAGGAGASGVAGGLALPARAWSGVAELLPRSARQYEWYSTPGEVGMHALPSLRVAALPLPSAAHRSASAIAGAEGAGSRATAAATTATHTLLAFGSEF
ncbi:hypothetical protein EON66_08650, partial [archaeon]